MTQETTHTPEPWYDGGGRIYYKDSNRAPSQCFIAKFYASPVYGMSVKSAVLNSERVVACINACEGMEDPAAEIAALKAQRDELLWALNVCAESLFTYGSHPIIEKQVNNAINKAKGGRP